MMRERVDEATYCALCEMLLARTSTPQKLTIGHGPEARRVLVCEDSSACRRRAIEMREEKSWFPATSTMPKRP